MGIVHNKVHKGKRNDAGAGGEMHAKGYVPGCMCIKRRAKWSGSVTERRNDAGERIGF